MRSIVLVVVVGAVITPGCGSDRALSPGGGGAGAGGGSCRAGGTGDTGGEPPLGDPFQTIEYVDATRPTPYASVKAIAAMAGGDLVVGGDFESELDVDPGPGVDLRDASPGSIVGAFVSRVRADGVARWTRSFAVTGSGVSSVAADASGAVIVSGVLDGASDVDPDDCEDPGATGQLAQVIKFSPQGHRLWSWALGGASSVRVAVAPDGKIVVYGVFSEPTDFDPGPAADIRTPSGPTMWEEFIVELDSNGRLARPAWTFGGNVNRVQIGADGSWYVAGTFTDGVDLDPGPAELRPTLTGSMEFGGYILALNADGQLRWAGIYPDPVYITELALGADGIFVTGTFPDGADLDPGPGEDRRHPVDGTIESFYGAFVGELDLDGRQRWVRTWGGNPSSLNTRGVVLLADGSPIVCGDSWGAIVVDGQSFSGNLYASSVFLIAFQPMGATGWIRTFPQGGNWLNCAGGFAGALDGTLLVAGSASGTFPVPFSGTLDTPPGLSGYVARLRLPE